MEPGTVVVGAAIVRDARVLAARRAYPPALAGRWELPGGKVEPGESDAEALVRECREELGVEVQPGARLGGEWPIGEHGILRVWLTTITDGEPWALEHAELRWLGAEQLFDVDWLPADLPIIERLAPVLRGAPGAD